MSLLQHILFSSRGCLHSFGPSGQNMPQHTGFWHQHRANFQSTLEGIWRVYIPSQSFVTAKMGVLGLVPSSSTYLRSTKAWFPFGNFFLKCYLWQCFEQTWCKNVGTTTNFRTVQCVHFYICCTLHDVLFDKRNTRTQNHLRPIVIQHYIICLVPSHNTLFSYKKKIKNWTNKYFILNRACDHARGISYLYLSNLESKLSMRGAKYSPKNFSKSVLTKLHHHFTLNTH